MRGKTNVRVKLFTSEHPEGIERTVPSHRLVVGQRTILDQAAGGNS